MQQPESIDNCAKCMQPITAQRPGCTAMTKGYHLDCFVCNQCQKRLAGGSFFAVEGKPYCESDYMMMLEKCIVCMKPIKERILRAGGNPYHPQCFTCSVCGKCLDNIPFTLDPNQKVHCVPCYHDRYAPRCAMCSKPIIPDEGKEESVRVIAMDKSFHVGCYRCEDCRLELSSKIEGHECYPLDGHLLCKKCNAIRSKQAVSYE